MPADRLHDDVERDVMEYDVVIVGAGPAGLAAAIRLKQRAAELGAEISVAVLEKGSEVGAHILSGVVFDPKALDELLPEWRTQADCPFDTEVTEDAFFVLGPSGALGLPGFALPPLMHNHGCFIGSLANLSRWLAGQAEALGVEIYPGFAAADLVYTDKGAVAGVRIGDLGVGRDGHRKDGVFTPGIDIHAKYTILSEGARGSLSKRVIREFKLDAGKEPQKFGLGLKELWQIEPSKHRRGLAQHSFGWPLDGKTGGGSFMYHFGENLVSIGFVVHLNYPNPYISPYEEFQRFKHHPMIEPVLQGGRRIAYGGRAITEGGWQSIPKLTFPGGALTGCAAGLVNVPRIKGSHNAMKSGMLAAEAAVEAILAGRAHDELSSYQERFDQSWIASELKLVRNAKPMWSKLGTAGGIMLGGVDMWSRTLLGGFSPFGDWSHGKADHAATEPAKRFKPIAYPKPDGQISFDRLTNVSFTSTNHEEDQPVHLKVGDLDLQKRSEYDIYAGLSQRYCPAGVYEWVTGPDGAPKFVINAQNCIHCKTCDIKDPNQNITWVTPEGGGGPNYPNM